MNRVRFPAGAVEGDSPLLYSLFKRFLTDSGALPTEPHVSSLEQAKTSGCLKRRGSAQHHKSRHKERLERHEPSMHGVRKMEVPVSHGRMLSDDFGRRRSARDSGATDTKAIRSAGLKATGLTLVQDSFLGAPVCSLTATFGLKSLK